MQIHWRAAAPDLARFAAGYALVDDRGGRLGGARVATAPAPFGVLSVNFADLSRDAEGRRHPRVAFLGLQSSQRAWRAGSCTAFAMVLLRPAGVMRLFAGRGRECADALNDLGDLWGRAATERFVEAARGGPEGRRQAALDDWLRERLAGSVRGGQPPAELLCAALRTCGGVAEAAQELGLSPRTLQRRLRADLGVSPRQLLSLERIQRSLQEAQRGGGALSPDDFADQAHEIRAWRRRVGTTPGRYRRAGPSAPASALTEACPSPRAPVFYL